MIAVSGVSQDWEFHKTIWISAGGKRYIDSIGSASMESRRIASTVGCRSQCLLSPRSLHHDIGSVQCLCDLVPRIRDGIFIGQGPNARTAHVIRELHSDHGTSGSLVSDSHAMDLLHNGMP